MLLICPEISRCDRTSNRTNGNRSGKSHSLWPDSMAVIGFLVLIFLGALHGFDNAGANTFSMAIAGPCYCQLGAFISWAEK